MTDKETDQTEPTVIMPSTSVRERTRIQEPSSTPEKTKFKGSEPGKKESKFKVVAEMTNLFDTLDDAMTYYGTSYHGDSDASHIVKVIDNTGGTVTSKSWSHYRDENGYRKVP